MQGPTALHWLGTDDIGRDIFSRLVYGGRITLGMVLAVVVMVAPFGLAVGCVAGYAGGAPRFALTATMKMATLREAEYYRRRTVF